MNKEEKKEFDKALAEHLDKIDRLNTNMEEVGIIDINDATDEQMIELSKRMFG